MKKILAIHDLSCFGRCALTVIIPTLSAMAHQVIPLPTALLSTHTGGFRDMVITDTSESMLPNFRHMVNSGAEIDAVYSGFLGNAKQIDTVTEIIKSLPEALICVDPVMGDNGALYQTYTEEMKQRMSELCSLADIITPNITEAAFLLNERYVDTAELSREGARAHAEGLIHRLKDKFGCAHIAITGIEFTENGTHYIGVATLSDSGFSFVENRHEGTGYPGTGDIFASVLIGDFLNGKSFDMSARRAAEYVRLLVCDTYEAKTTVRNGVLLEKNLYRLFRE